MDILWAPWRSKYIESLGKSDQCIFCIAAQEKDSQKVLKLYQTEHCLVVLNLYPYNTAHTMIAPIRHIGKFEQLTEPELLDININTQRSIKIINKLFNPGAYNLGANLGKIAGAGIPGHFHLHLVPRWEGDTHFMPIFGETKVFSFSLSEIWTKMYQEFNSFRDDGNQS